jgi:hypothetical protein
MPVKNLKNKVRESSWVERTNTYERLEMWIL